MLVGHDQMQSHGGNMGGGGRNRFVGGEIENPISIDDMNGNMGNLRVSQGAGGGGGGQGAGGGINSVFARGGNGGGSGIGSNRGGGGGDGGGGRSGNNGMFMGTPP